MRLWSRNRSKHDRPDSDPQLNAAQSLSRYAMLVAVSARKHTPEQIFDLTDRTNREQLITKLESSRATISLSIVYQERVDNDWCSLNGLILPGPKQRRP